MKTILYQHRMTKRSARASIIVVLLGLVIAACFIYWTMPLDLIIVGFFVAMLIVVILALTTVKDVLVEVSPEKLVLRGIRDPSEWDIAAIRRIEVVTQGGEVSMNWGDTLIIELSDGEKLEIDGTSLGGAQAVADALQLAMTSRHRTDTGDAVSTPS